EENDTSFAVHTAAWFHTELGLAPAYWQLGNEPTGWTHFGINVSSWSTYDASPASDLGYATMVHDYISAVHADYPGDRFIGLEASCGCDTSQAQTTAQVDGAQVSAMAFHNYPSTGGSSSSLNGFYAALTSSTNLTNNLARFTGAVSAGCSGCASLPIEVGEYQSGPAQAFSPYAQTYAGAVFVGASVIQALESNVSMFTLFDSGALFNAGRNAPTFQGLLYQRILENMTMGTDYNAPVADQGVGGVYSVVVHNGSRSALLLVNTNTSYALNLTIPAIAFPTGTVGSVWQWQPGEPVPTDVRSEILPSTYLVSAQGVLLLTTY
ncbi:MAG: hypothetical protein L3K17_02370, partial [Thermoplasmata archaeon]|nr:hypothetical protein [Thermoplasmata archaeon]